MTERHNRLQMGNQLYHQDGLDDGTWAFDAANAASLAASPFSLNSGTPVISPGAAGPSQVVFIDSRTPDIADLINGDLQGEQIFVLDPTQDGLDQLGSRTERGAPSRRQQDHMSKKIVFIDAQVPNLQNLLNLSATNSIPGDDAQAVLLDGERDALLQIAETLDKVGTVDVLHIMSHGAPGELCFAAGSVSAEHLIGQKPVLDRIAAALAPGANLLVWSCNVAGGAKGARFISLLADATGANVIAATHTVGHADGGGTWNLDVATSMLPARPPLPFAAHALSAVQGTLSFDPFTVVSGPVVLAEVNNGGSNEFMGVNVASYNSSGTYKYAITWENDLTVAPYGDSVGLAVYSFNGSISSSISTSNPIAATASNFNSGPVVTFLTAGADAGDIAAGWSVTSNPSSAPLDTNVEVLTQSGSVVTGAFTANQTTAGDQYGISLAGLSDGRLAAVWQTSSSTGGGYGSIHGAIYNANGSIFDPEFNIQTSSTASNAQVVMLGAGKMEVVWQTTTSVNDGHVYAAQVTYDPSNASAPVVAVSELGSAAIGTTTTANIQFLPSVAALNDGGFVTAFGSYNNATTNSDLLGHIVTGTGAVHDFTIAASTASTGVINSFESISTATLSDGDVVVAWLETDASTGGASSVEVQLLDATGALIGTKHTIATGSLAQSNQQVSVAALQSGKFVVSWVNDGGADGYDYTVQSEVLAANQPPTANPDGNTAVSGGAAATGSLLTNDTDPDGDTLTVTGFTDGSGGTLGTLFHGRYGDLTLNANGTYSYLAGATPGEQAAIAAAATGNHPTEVVSYIESDGHGGTSSSTLTITLDRAPATNNISDTLVAGTTTATFTGGTAGTGALHGDTDPDGDTPVITLVQANSGSAAALTQDGAQHSFAGNYGTLSIADNGTYSYTANSNIASPTGSHPVDTFTLTVGDNGGAATAIETLAFTVDRAPTLTLNVPSQNYTAQTAPIMLQSGVTIADPDGSGGLASATVTVTGGYAGDGDLLSYNGNVGTVTLGDGSQYNVAYSGAGTTETLAITTTSGIGTQADYIQLLDGVVFSSTSADPTNAGAYSSRSANFQVTDSGGASSATAGPETLNIQLAPAINSVVATTVGNVTDLDATKVVTITVNFSNSVNVTGTPELQLNDGEVASYTGGTGTTALTFSYTVQPNDNTADLSVQSLLLSGGTIKDGAGHDAVLTNAAADLHLQVDTTAPSVSSITALGSSPNHGSSEAFTVTFSEAVTGVDATDFTATTSGTSDTGISVVPVSGSVYTVTINGVTGDGTVGLNLNSSGTGIDDLAGNALSGGFTGPTYTVDHTPPTVSSITALGSSPNHASSEQFQVVFSESVSGVVASDFALTTTNTPGGTALTDTGITSITGSGTTWTVTVGGVSGDGTLRLDLKSGSTGITDTAGNGATAAFTGGDVYTIEHTPPSVSSIVADGANPNNAGSDQFTVTFTEAVTGVDASDFTATHSGTVADASISVTGSGNTYTVTVNGVTGDGTLRLDLNASGTGITDAAGNATSGGFTGGDVYTIDHTAPAAPTLALTHDTGISNSDNITSDPSITYSTSAPGDTLLYKVDGGSYSAAVPVFATDHSADGSHTVSVEEVDAAGNVSSAASLSFTLDTIAPAAPTLALTHDTGVSNTDHLTSDPSITYALSAAGDTLLYKVDGGGYSATVPVFATDHSADGLHTVSVEEVDAAGNVSSAASLSFTLDTIAPTAPTLALTHDTGVSDTDGITSDPSITYSTPATGDTLLYKVDGGSYSATVPVFATDHSADGSHTVSVEEVDAAGNVSSAASLSFTLDTTAPAAPALALTHDTGVSNTDHLTSDPSITYSTPATGDTLLYKVDGGSYSATVPAFATNGSADGLHTVSVEEVDAAGNVSTAASLSFTLDTADPTVSVTADHTALLAGQTALMTFTFSEAVSGFVLGDTTVSGGSLSNLVHVGINGSNQDIYTATFTPNASNTEAGSVEVNASSYSDIAGNNGTASNTVTLTGDTLAPTAVATASPSIGTEVIGDLVQITLAFGEAVTIAGSTPALALNDGGTATYDAAATAALHDASKLVFDYTVASSDANSSPLAITGVAHGTTITDLAGNAAGVAATFTGLGVVTSLVTAHPDTNHVVANQTVTADAAHGVLANDPDTNPADHVVVSAVDGLAADVNQPIAGAYGTLTLHADGSYVYAADNAVTGEGTDTFTYTASNGHGPDSTSTLTITVSGANQSYVQVPSGGSATGGYNNTVLDGSAGGATLTAAATFNAHQILVGGPGDILNAASFGQDTFVFADNFGHETINNFHPALDVIQLQQSQFGSLAAVMADIQQVGADSVLTLDANHVITITDTPHTSLTASDFHLV